MVENSSQESLGPGAVQDEVQERLQDQELIEFHQQLQNLCCWVNS